MLKKLSKAEYEALSQDGRVIERDGYGVKVMQLPGQRILKLFRRKRLFSSQLWITHAARFARNARKLHRRGIPTIETLSVFTVPEIKRSAVLYKMLEGETLRDWLDTHDKASIEPKLEALGTFIAKLHQKGVLFRSLHLGNVLVLPNGEFGLIDIADTGFRPFGPLSPAQRIRNFHHMDRHDDDRDNLAGPAGRKFIQSYVAATRLSEKTGVELTDAFEAIFAPYRK